MNNCTKKTPLRNNVFFNLLYEVLLIITPLITAPYISRILGPSGVGIYGYSYSLVSYFTMFAALGTITYGKREIARKRENKDDYSKAFWEIELLTIITSTICLLLWVIVFTFYIDYRIYLIPLSLSILATLFDISWLYAGLEKFKYTVLINSIFKILSIIAVFLFIKKNSDVLTYIVITALSTFLGSLSMWLFLPFNVKKTSINFGAIRIHFKETLVYFVPTIAATAYAVLDKTLIGLLIEGETTKNVDGSVITYKISDIENGYYDQAVKIINLLRTLCFTSVNAVATVRASYLHSMGKREESRFLFFNVMDITGFLTIGASFGMLLVANEFVPLFFGNGYEKTIILLYILSFMLPPLFISNTLGSLYYTPSGNKRKSAKYTIIGSISNLVLSIPLVIAFKSIGAAVASLIAEYIIAFLYIRNAPVFIGFKEIIKILWKKIIAGIIMFFAGIVAKIYLFDMLSSFFSILLSVILGAIIYILILFLLRDNSLKNVIKSIIHFFKSRQKE